MKASLTWMQEYVPVDMSKPAQILADELTMAGIPVEEVVSLDKGLEKIYTGKITKIEQHPDADKLVVCQVACKDENGEDIQKQIVTAAKNVREGHIVPVAYHKSRLADGTVIKKGKLRGVVSEGMFCSVAELGIAKDQVLPHEGEGIYILPENTPIGADIRDVLALRDIVYEFELTPNRADCFCMVGLSREFAAMTGETATMPTVEVNENGEAVDGRVHITIADKELCSRFAARLVENITVKPSPLWMQNRLRAAGVRPINNVVDVTNYVMLELGQPMHAYDYDKVAGHHLTARLAKADERLVTLDGTECALNETMLVIADEQGPVGVAGVMGGLDSEVSEATTTVIFESATFKGSSVRKTARALGMRSEASGRFERGVNAEFSRLAIDRAAQLLQQICPEAVVAAGVVDEYPTPAEKRSVAFTEKEINAYLGTSIAKETMKDILTKLSFIVDEEGETMIARVPSWRDDVAILADISEEVARLYGYENIPTTTPVASLRSGVLSGRKGISRTIANSLSKQGLSEIITFSFMHKDSLAKLLLPESDAHYRAVPILNPISEEFPLLRTTLIPIVLETAVRNQAKKNHDVWLFETGAVYIPKALPMTELPEERWYTAGVMMGNVTGNEWPNTVRATDFYDVKGVVEELLQAVGLYDLALVQAKVAWLHPGVSAAYMVGEECVAVFGKLHPQAAKNYDLPENTYVFEIATDTLLSLGGTKVRYTSLSKYPSISRDLAIVAPVSVPNGVIMEIIRREGGSYLEQAYVFDVYEGEHIEAGFRSMAYSLSFRSAEGTLTDEDIETAIQAILTALAEKGCTLR